jgi:hypothetical protein
MASSQDSWISSALGVDVGSIVSSVTDTVSSAASAVVGTMESSATSTADPATAAPAAVSADVGTTSSSGNAAIAATASSPLSSPEPDADAASGALVAQPPNDPAASSSPDPESYGRGYQDGLSGGDADPGPLAPEYLTDYQEGYSKGHYEFSQRNASQDLARQIEALGGPCYDPGKFSYDELLQKLQELQEEQYKGNLESQEKQYNATSDTRYAGNDHEGGGEEKPEGEESEKPDEEPNISRYYGRYNFLKEGIRQYQKSISIGATPEEAAKQLEERTGQSFELTLKEYEKLYEIYGQRDLDPVPVPTEPEEVEQEQEEQEGE